MIKRFFLIVCFVFSMGFAIATEETNLIEENSIQTKINTIGTEILNSNKLEKRVIFVYNKDEKSNFLKNNKPITKRQIVIYKDIYKNIENDDELAAFIAREIPSAIRSYDGLGNGLLSSVKMKAAPKKYELVFDKLAVDYMVKAGYNPIGLITYINKTCPQSRQDLFSGSNLTSKRLAYIYERIYTEYPDFLINNKYLDNIYYQNFLLTSLENRKKVQEKAKDPKNSKRIKYE